jgi:hypothetical protein
MLIQLRNIPRVVPLLDTYCYEDGVRVLVLPQLSPFPLGRQWSLKAIGRVFDQLFEVCCWCWLELSDTQAQHGEENKTNKKKSSSSRNHFVTVFVLSLSLSFFFLLDCSSDPCSGSGASRSEVGEHPVGCEERVDCGVRL